MIWDDGKLIQLTNRVGKMYRIIQLQQMELSKGCETETG